MKRSTIVIAMVSFLVGLSAVPIGRDVYLAVWGSRSVNCFNGVCVGASQADALQRLTDLPSREGGLNRLVCGDTPNGRLFGLSDMINGRCERSSYIFVFSDGHFEHQVHIEGGRVVRIDTVPTNFIDL
jgi:hypothetical protein